MIGYVLSGASIVLSIVALVVARRTRQVRHIDAVSLHTTFVVGILNEENHPEVILRNDGTAAITYQNVSMAYGDLTVTDRHKPKGWGLLNLRAWGVLAPGEERRLPRPDDLSGVGILGPVAIVDDAAGQRWYITMYSKHRDPSTPPRVNRRHVWFERRRRWQRRADRLETWAARRQERRPGRLPVVPMLIDWLWGWHAGSARAFFGPMNAPLGWRYVNGGDWEIPEVPNEPTYGWRIGAD